MLMFAELCGVMYLWQMRKKGFWPMLSSTFPMNDLCFYPRVAFQSTTFKQCTNTSQNPSTVLWSLMMIPPDMVVDATTGEWDLILNSTNEEKGHNGLR